MKTGISGRQRQTSSAATPKDGKNNPEKDGRAENTATDGVAQCSATNDTAAEQALKEKAKIALLREAKRGAERVETMGTQGWRQPSSYATNKRFLSRTLASTMFPINGSGSNGSRKRQRSTSPKEKRRDMPIYKATRGEERVGQLPSSEAKKRAK